MVNIRLVSLIHKDGPDSAVALTQTSKNKFTVTYGLQVRKGLCYADAAREYGECIMHSAACATASRAERGVRRY